MCSYRRSCANGTIERSRRATARPMPLAPPTNKASFRHSILIILLIATLRTRTSRTNPDFVEPDPGSRRK